MVNSSNPLVKHFRQPQLYIKLPSGGRWYPQGALEMPVTKEIPVMAMTAKDELTLKTPDALLNGQSTVDVIQSCIPAIKDAWKMPSVDLDAVLIAIRQATYGSAMEFASMCPHCGHKNEHTIDLAFLSDQLTCPDFEEPVKINGLEIFIKPQNYFQFNRANIENFEQQRLISVVNDATLSNEEKTARFDVMFKKLLDLTVEQVSNSVSAIKMEDGTVVDKHEYIDDFFHNCDRTVWDAVKNRLTAMGEQNPLKKVDVTCDEDDCSKPYITPLVFEQSNFFG